ncbi:MULTISPECIES: hypothetical protein [unclassified Corallococcus]|uniref:hypothetical protein n=1 Tax=unclassified Corallococcus TaxID=2685029 RepID=UPI0011C4808A|nr:MULTISPECIES: hypothetical protein [unclassified Corallococcus]
MNSAVDPPSPRHVRHRYSAFLPIDLIKAAARADVERLKERFRVELNGSDFRLEEIPLANSPKQ